MKGRDGSALLWLLIALILVMIMGTAVFALMQGDGEEAGPQPGPGAAKNEIMGESPSPPEGETPAGQERQEGNAARPAPPAEEGGPTGNVRDPAIPVTPPVESAQEAFSAVTQLPEVRDWYWSVEQPRYQARDEGDRYLVRLYALIPAEGTVPERSAFFGEYLVIKSDGSVSRAQ